MNDVTDTYLGGLPPLPEPEVTIPMGWVRPGLDVYTADQMNTHYLAGYEAGRASRAQSEPRELIQAAAHLIDLLDDPTKDTDDVIDYLHDDFRVAFMTTGDPATLGETK